MKLPSQGIRKTICAVALCAAAASSAQAQTKLTVYADRAKVVNIAGTPAAAVVGNPTYADVTVRQGQIIVHGRQFGSTNLIVLDTEGNQIANMEIAVERMRPQGVVIYKAGLKHSYNCTPNCESVLEVGDSPGYFEDVVEKQMNKKVGTAQGSAKLSE